MSEMHIYDPALTGFRPAKPADFNTVTVSGTATVAVSGTPTVAAQDSIFWNESTTAQGASAVVTGTTRDVGVAAGAAHRYSMFNASAWADQAGSLKIQVSNDNATWRDLVADTAVAANTPVILSVPIMTRYYRAVFTNGAVAQAAFMLNTSFTAA